MSKELPYFRFTVSEWLNGDISMEQMEDQGLFINVCAFYWFKDCSLALAKLKQKFKGAETSLNRLLDSGILKVDENDNIIIDFLDEQFIKLSELHNIRSKAGRKGGLSKPKAKLKQKRSYKDKDKDNNKDKDKENLLRIKKVEFRTELSQYLEKYDDKMLEEFFKYWSEFNKSKTKMRLELEKTWDMNLRLQRWARNYKPDKKKPGESAGENYKFE